MQHTPKIKMTEPPKTEGRETYIGRQQFMFTGTISTIQIVIKKKQLTRTVKVKIWSGNPRKKNNQSTPFEACREI